MRNTMTIVGGIRLVAERGKDVPVVGHWNENWTKRLTLSRMKQLNFSLTRSSAV